MWAGEGGGWEPGDRPSRALVAACDDHCTCSAGARSLSHQASMSTAVARYPHSLGWCLGPTALFVDLLNQVPNVDEMTTRGRLIYYTQCI